MLIYDTDGLFFFFYDVSFHISLRVTGVPDYATRRIARSVSHSVHRYFSLIVIVVLLFPHRFPFVLNILLVSLYLF